MPQFSVDSRTIDNVIGYINNGQIAIPEIQRPFVWDGSKIRDLIDSLYNGFPVGYLIVWQNPNMKDKEGNLTSGKMIMIDGQQRVTAIMTALVGLKVLDKDFNERIYKIAFNPFAQNDEQRFEVQSAAILKDKRWIADIAELFKPDFNSWDFVESFCQANPDMERPKLSSLIQNVINIKNCPIGIIHLNDGLSIDEVTEIFIRINSQGKALTQADFVMSTIASDEKYGGYMLRKAIDYFSHLAKNHDFINKINQDKEFVESEYYSLIKWMSNYQFNIFTPIFDDVLRTSFMTKYDRGKLANLTDLLHGRNFETRSFEESIQEESFIKFTDGVRNYCNEYTFKQFFDTIKSAGFVYPRLVKGRMALDFAYTLFMRLRNDSSIEKLKVAHYVQRWYVMSVLTGRYVGSPETQMERDLRAISDKGFMRYYNEVMANLAETFWEVTLPQSLQSSSTTTPAFLVYLAAQCKMNDDSFLNPGAKVRDLLETADIHHIFPRKYLQNSGINTVVRYNQVANFAILSKPINIAIGMKAPNDYMKEVYDACMSGNESKYTTIITSDDLINNCRTSCIPIELKDMDYQDYDNFLEKRRLLMAQKIRDYFYSL